MKRLAFVVLLLLLSGCSSTILSSGKKTSTASDQEPLRLAYKAATGRCGVELWADKTMTDPQAGNVDLTPTPTDIATLTDSNVNPIADPNRTSRAPMEMRVWRVQTTLKGYKLESDSDIHLQLDGMIGEIPDPACAQGSTVLPQITQARARFLATYQIGNECFDCLNVPITIDGVGFFDHPHGQHGAAGNQAELHPIVGISLTPPLPGPISSSTVATTASTPTTTTPTTTTPICHDRDRRKDKVEFPRWIPASDSDLRDDIHERRAHIC